MIASVASSRLREIYFGSLFIMPPVLESMGEPGNGPFRLVGIPQSSGPFMFKVNLRNSMMQRG